MKKRENQTGPSHSSLVFVLFFFGRETGGDGREPSRRRRQDDRRDPRRETGQVEAADERGQRHHSAPSGCQPQLEVCRNRENLPLRSIPLLIE